MNFTLSSTSPKNTSLSSKHRYSYSVFANNIKIPSVSIDSALLQKRSINRKSSILKKINYKFRKTIKTIESPINKDDLDNTDFLFEHYNKSLYSKISEKSAEKLKFKKNSDNKINEKHFLEETPSSFKKEDFFHNKNFKKLFTAFLNNQTDMNTLIKIKNFPHIFAFDENSDYLVKENNKKEINENRKKIIKFKFNENTSEIPQKIIKEETEKKLDNFDSLRKLINERIAYKKIIKNEGNKTMELNVKFLQNFYSIYKEYIEKIKKKDLLAINTTKSYYEKCVPPNTKLLKHCTFLGDQKIKRKPNDLTIPKHNKLFEDYLNLNSNSYLLSISERLNNIKKKNNVVPHLSHLKKNKTLQDYINEPEIKEKKSKKKEDYLCISSKRNEILKKFINFKEDLDFFIKNKGVLPQELLFLTEISKIDSIDQQYILNNLLTVNKSEDNLIRVKDSIKTRSHYDSQSKDVQDRKTDLFIKRSQKLKNNNTRYFKINRNKPPEEKNDLLYHMGQEDDTSLPSLTEATLDGLYSKSIALQKKILNKKNKGLGNKLKEFLRLEEISKEVQKINKIKLN